MDFGKALEALKAGKNVRQSTWNINYYIIYDNVHDKNEYPFGSFDGITTYKDGTYSRNLFEFTPEHLIAENWEILEDIPEVKLHVKEYFTCPKCGHENIAFHLDNWYSKCTKCETKVKTLPRCDTQNKNYAKISEKYSELLEKMIDELHSRIVIENAWQFDRNLSAFKQCLKMLKEIESKELEQQHKGTN